MSSQECRSPSSSSSTTLQPPDSMKSPGKSTSMERRKMAPNDFYFGRLIGEGSFSSVYLAKEVATGREFAVKVCEKEQIVKEKKQDYIYSEKKILVKISANWDEKIPFFVKLHSTMQDNKHLYFVMTYAKNGDLLKFIDELSKKDVDVIQFYAAELLTAVEFLHKLGIIHRDLKPENILLNGAMHILITDFGSATVIEDDEDDEDDHGAAEPLPKRRTFVGTAQYVSPEILSARGSSPASDLWAIGCILYQMLTGLPPFQSQSEYLIFQKIQKLEYSFHEGFNEDAKDLIKRLLVIEPSERIGARDAKPYESIRKHPFFSRVDFDSLLEAIPPAVKPFVSEEDKPDPVWSRNPDIKPGAERLIRLMIEETACGDSDLNEVLQKAMERNSHVDSQEEAELERQKRSNIIHLTDDERRELMEEQCQKNKYHKFVEGNLIIKEGILDKRKGLWARRRMFLLTEGPHLYYVDPEHMILKGEIPWSPTIRPEIRDFKTFFVHTPNRVYYLTDPEAKAKDWCRAIQEVRNFYFGDAET